MNQRIGTYVQKNGDGESYNAYIPPKLPPNPPIDLTFLYPKVVTFRRKVDTELSMIQ